MFTKFADLNTAQVYAKTHSLRQRVCVYITREKVTGQHELLVFEHTPDYPTAGIQVPAGGLEPNETVLDGGLREAFEETGLTNLEPQCYLGSNVHFYGSRKPQVWHFIWLTTAEPRNSWSHLAQEDSEETYTFLHRFAPLQTAGLHYEMDALLPELGQKLGLELVLTHPELRPVVVCYITRGQEILVFSGHPDGGIGVVAGGIEAGETPEEAAMRETLEESGLHVANPVYLGRHEWRFVGVNPFTEQHSKFHEDRFYYHFQILEPRDGWEWLVSDGVNDKGKVFKHRFVRFENAQIDWDMPEFLPRLMQQ